VQQQPAGGAYGMAGDPYGMGMQQQNPYMVWLIAGAGNIGCCMELLAIFFVHCLRSDRVYVYWMDMWLQCMKHGEVLLRQPLLMQGGAGYGYVAPVGYGMVCSTSDIFFVVCVLPELTQKLALVLDINTNEWLHIERFFAYATVLGAGVWHGSRIRRSRRSPSSTHGRM
jgi:hypothetical protein